MPIFTLLADILLAAAGHPPVQGTYENRIGTVWIRQRKDAGFDFRINTVVGDSFATCDAVGTAALRGDGTAEYNERSGEPPCQLRFTFQRDRLDVSASCDGNCGMAASGSMNGQYRRVSQQVGTNTEW